MRKISYIRRLDQVDQLSDKTKAILRTVCETYKFRANDYYLSLIDWDNPDDPIRRIIIPQVDELADFGELDASLEETNYVAPGCQHKYPHTALLLCNQVCGGFCRFCFRKRLFMDDNDEVRPDIGEAVDYISRNRQITNVLLSGGDPLMMSTRRLDDIIGRLRDISHVGIIRLGTKMPAFNPWRIIDDPELLAMIARYSHGEKRIYVMTHFNTVAELTPAAIKGLSLLMKAGAVLANQTPVLRGINGTPEDLAALMRKLSFIGVPPYYFFQCRPTVGNKPYAMTLTETYQVVEGARKRVSGLAKRARLVMSHHLGKIEIAGLTPTNIYLKFHRARRQRDEDRFLIYHRDDRAYWLDDLIPAEPERPSIIRRWNRELREMSDDDTIYHA